MMARRLETFTIYCRRAESSCAARTSRLAHGWAPNPPVDVLRFMGLEMIRDVLGLCLLITHSSLDVIEYRMISRRYRTRKHEYLFGVPSMFPCFKRWNLKHTHRNRFLDFWNLEHTLHILKFEIYPVSTGSIFILKSCLPFHEGDSFGHDFAWIGLISTINHVGSTVKLSYGQGRR